MRAFVYSSEILCYLILFGKRCGIACFVIAAMVLKSIPIIACTISELLFMVFGSLVCAFPLVYTQHTICTCMRMEVLFEVARFFVPCTMNSMCR